jgi:hypothetical protein
MAAPAIPRIPVVVICCDQHRIILTLVGRVALFTKKVDPLEPDLPGEASNSHKLLRRQGWGGEHYGKGAAMTA